MGFRQGGYCSVWSTELSKSGKTTIVRLSSSRKNQSGEYEQDFSGFCTFIGKAHEMAQKLQPKDRIKILECDVGTSYDKEKEKEYINYKVFDFEMAGNKSEKDNSKSDGKKQNPFEVDGGESDPNDNLPF